VRSTAHRARTEISGAIRPSPVRVTSALVIDADSMPRATIATPSCHEGAARKCIAEFGRAGRNLKEQIRPRRDESYFIASSCALQGGKHVSRRCRRSGVRSFCLGQPERRHASHMRSRHRRSALCRITVRSRALATHTNNTGARSKNVVARAVIRKPGHPIGACCAAHSDGLVRCSRAVPTCISGIISSCNNYGDSVVGHGLCTNNLNSHLSEIDSTNQSHLP
jgi:hypothetical protein